MIIRLLVFNILVCSIIVYVSTCQVEFVVSGSRLAINNLLSQRKYFGLFGTLLSSEKNCPAFELQLYYYCTRAEGIEYQLGLLLQLIESLSAAPPESEFSIGLNY